MKIPDRLVLAWARWAPRAMLLLTAAVGCARPPAPADNRMFKGGQSPATMTQEAILDLEMARLHAHVQPDGPVAVQWVDGLIESEGALAVTQRAGPGFLIQLDRSLTGFVLADTVVHEWAHALSPSRDHAEFEGTCGGHGAQWGIEFSRAYRAVWYDADTEDAAAQSLITIMSSAQPGVSQKDPPPAGGDEGITEYSGTRAVPPGPQKR